jgi:hypothetical protein
MVLINEVDAFIRRDHDFCGVTFLHVFYEHIASSYRKVTLVSRELVIGTAFSSAIETIFLHVAPNAVMWHVYLSWFRSNEFMA